ncbi:SMI1/KNR4 family protein [bacterium]|nr:SMI1/KNR4 family protein [bacterium]
MAGNEIDAALESAVRSLRAAAQRAGCTATFKPGDKKELARVIELYPQLPVVYRRFLEKHDPQDALFSPAPENAIALLPLQHLEDGQLGFSVHSTTGHDLTGQSDGDWRDSWIVVGDDNDTPFFLECAEAKGTDAPVYHAWKEGGRWQRSLAASSFERFLRLCAAYMDGYRNWEDPEADDFQMPDRVRVAINRNLRQVDPELDTEAYWLA